MKKNFMFVFGFLGLIVFIVAGLLIFGCNQDSDDDDDNDNESDDDDSAICNSTCWQYSPEQATGSLDQADQWATECETADSGCPDKICVAAYMEFYNTPENLRYSIQCETSIPDDRYYECVGQDAALTYFGLGDDYGFLSEENCKSCPSEMEVPTGWTPMGFPESIEDAPLWNEDKISDVLAHDVSDIPCEQIDDYHQCVRAFIPPDIHCVPKIYDDQFFNCYEAQEPYNRDPGWLDIVNACK